MPKRSRSKSMLVKRSAKKRATPNSRIVIMRNPKYTAPAGVEVVLKYFERNNLSSAIVGVDARIYRGASVYDPDFAGIGHQPLGFDQWASIYQRYRVISCKCIATYHPLADGDTVIPFINATETSSVHGNPDTYIESPFSVWGAPINANGTSNKTLIMNIKTAQFEGDSGALYDKDYTADVGGNPTRDWFYHVGVMNANFADASVDCRLATCLEYTVRFYDRIDLQRS